MTTIVDIISIILYELQPIRPKDAVKLTKWVKKNVSQLIVALKDLIIWLGAQLLSLKHVVRSISYRWIIIMVCWVLGLLLSIKIGFAAVFCMLSGMGLIFANLGTRAPGELSAYSVFNKNFQRLLGTLTAEQFDQEIRHRGNFENDDEDAENNQAQRHEGPDLTHRKVSGKKARRGYEKKLQRRQEQQQQQLQQQGEWMDEAGAGEFLDVVGGEDGEFDE